MTSSSSSSVFGATASCVHIATYSVGVRFLLTPDSHILRLQCVLHCVFFLVGVAAAWSNGHAKRFLIGETKLGGVPKGFVKRKVGGVPKGFAKSWLFRIKTINST